MFYLGVGLMPMAWETQSEDSLAGYFAPGSKLCIHCVPNKVATKKITPTY